MIFPFQSSARWAIASFVVACNANLQRQDKSDTSVSIQSWPRKSAQDDRWSFCLSAGTLLRANQDVKSLHAKIGELTLENDFLEGALTKAGLLSAKR